MYRYDLHVHTKEASLCGQSTAREIVQGYAAAGYNGIVITDHFIHGNTAVPRNLPWDVRMQAYADAYLAAKEEGDRCGLTVLFGLEHKFGNGGKEVLVYGVEPQMLFDHPEINTMEIEAFCELMHSFGLYISMAHPFRKRDYIPEPGVSVELSCLDALEVYNASNADDENFRALYYAAAHGLGMTSGGDIHLASSERIGRAGMVFPRPVNDNADLLSMLKSGEGKILCGGISCEA